MSIIRHADPNAAQVSDSEMKWIGSHLQLGAVKRSGVMNSPAGAISLEEVSHITILPISADYWRIASVLTTYRKQGDEVNQTRMERTCDVWPKRINWQSAQIKPYEASLGESYSSAYSVSIQAEKGAICVDIAPLGWPPAHSESRLIFLLFQTEGAAREFVKEVAEHEGPDNQTK